MKLNLLSLVVAISWATIASADQGHDDFIQYGSHSLTGGDEYAYQQGDVLHMIVGSEEYRKGESVWVIRHYTQKGNNMQDLASLDMYYDEQSYQDAYLSTIHGKVSLQVHERKKVETEVQNNVLWRAENQWNMEWEQRYRDWVSEDVHKDIFLDHGIATDCANVGFFLRWIFAREHRLPMASTMAGSGALITNHTMRHAWRSLPTSQNWYDDQRFRAVLAYVADTTFTGTLKLDSYPTKISNEIMGPGSYYLYRPVRGFGHLTFIHRFNHDNATITSLESTLPSEVRRLVVRSIGFSQPFTEVRSVRRHRWAVQNQHGISLLADTSHPYFSEEQFQDDFARDNRTTHLEVLYRLGFQFTDRMITDWFRRLIRSSLIARRDVVNDGRAFCSENPCEPGSENYNSWSTPSRDARIIEIIEDYLEFCKDSLECLSRPNNWSPSHESWYRTSPLFFVRHNLIRYDVVVERFYLAYLTGELSSDPRDRHIERWGLLQDLGTGEEVW